MKTSRQLVLAALLLAPLAACSGAAEAVAPATVTTTTTVTSTATTTVTSTRTVTATTTVTATETVTATPAVVTDRPNPEPSLIEPQGVSTTAASYANCSAARAAGVAPLTTNDPGYVSKLDRDGDGIACE